jgi:acyl dehydratase
MKLDEIKEFADKYDPLPIHLDSKYASDSIYNGIIASGFHTLCTVWGQFVKMNRTGTEVVGGLGVDNLRWSSPVYPGDVLSSEVEVIDLITSSKGGRGIVVTRTTAFNQDKKIVMVLDCKALIKCKN